MRAQSSGPNPAPPAAGQSEQMRLLISRTASITRASLDAVSCSAEHTQES